MQCKKCAVSSPDAFRRNSYLTRELDTRAKLISLTFLIDACSAFHCNRADFHRLAVKQCSLCLHINSVHVCFWVTSATSWHLLDYLPDLLVVLSSHLYIVSREVFFQIPEKHYPMCQIFCPVSLRSKKPLLDALCAGNRDDIVSLEHEPGESQLARCASFLLGQFLDPLDQLECWNWKQGSTWVDTMSQHFHCQTATYLQVFWEVLLAEARSHSSEIAFFEIIRRLVFSSQEASSERRVRYDSDA